MTITGDTLIVELSDAADQYVIADAVRNVEMPTAPVTDGPRYLDDGDAGYSDSGWSLTPVLEGRLNVIRCHAAGNGSEIAAWTFTGLTRGNFNVAATWSSHANRATDAPITIYDGATSLGTVDSNQRIAPDDFTTEGSGWEDLMEVEITGDTLVVELSNAANGFVIADTIRIQPVTRHAPTEAIVLRTLTSQRVYSSGVPLLGAADGGYDHAAQPCGRNPGHRHDEPPREQRLRCHHAPRVSPNRRVGPGFGRAPVGSCIRSSRRGQEHVRDCAVLDWHLPAAACRWGKSSDSLQRMPAFSGCRRTAIPSCDT